MRHNIIETLIGTIVLGIAGLFLTFAYSKSRITPSKGTASAIAQFQRVDGIVLGSDVRISGVKVGAVSDIKVHPETYMALVTLTYDRHIKLPRDTSAEIISNGILGNKYIALVPGADEEFLKDGEEIHHTQSSINLEALIGQAIFNKSSS